LVEERREQKKDPVLRRRLETVYDRENKTRGGEEERVEQGRSGVSQLSK